MSVVRQWVRGRHRHLRLLAIGAWLAMAGCSGSDGVQPDPAVEQFVGDWLATSMVLTSAANPDVHPDLIELGATFSVNVQPSGQYTAILLYSGQAQTEIGQLTVSGGSVTLQPSYPPSAQPATSSYSFPDADHFVLDGNTEFDFNLDGTPEAATAHIVFARK
jgi:hypothetical protein